MATNEPEPIDEVLFDLGGHLNDTTMAVSLASAGLRQFRRFFEDNMTPVASNNPDPRLIMGRGDPNDPTSVMFAEWRRSRVIAGLEAGGEVHRMLGQQWIVLFFGAWEEHFRPRLAAAHGVQPKDMRHPFFGDLRLLRNDIVHHLGIATSHNSGRCSLLTTWYQIGSPVSPPEDMHTEVIQRFPWNELRRRPDGSTPTSRD